MAYEWLPIADVAAWLQVDVDTPALDAVREAAADYCESQRPDLVVVVDDVPTFLVTPRIVQAGLLSAGRLWARRTSPAGLASYGEFGASEILRLDPDVSRLLGAGRFAKPAVG